MTAKSQKHWTGDPAQLLRVREGFRLVDVDPESTPGFTGGKKARGRGPRIGRRRARRAAGAALRREPLRADRRQQSSWCCRRWTPAGKGGIIRHVVGSVDPQGISLAAFKKPTKEELAHDFLWRIEKRVPEPGFIGVFDRSHYEDVLIGKVREFAPPEEIERRYGAINDFEKRLTDAGTRVIKVMLHISPEEQKERLAERLDRPDKHWKYNPGDVDERARWPKYMDAYQVVFERTSTDYAPWYVIPANRKWYARLAVQALLLETLEQIDPQWPVANFDIEAEKARLAAT